MTEDAQCTCHFGSCMGQYKVFPHRELISRPHCPVEEDGAKSVASWLLGNFQRQ